MKHTVAAFAAMLLLASCAGNQLKVSEFVTSTMNEPWEAGCPELSDGMPGDTLVLNTDVTGQTIQGFGVSFSELSAQSLLKLSEEDRNTVLDELFIPGKGASLIINRCPIAANDFARDWYSYDEVDGDFQMENFSIARDEEILLPLIKDALKRNPEMKIWATPWCPPTWMKRNHHYAMAPARVNDLPEEGRGREGEDMFILDDRYFEAYALYFKKYIEAYRAQGVDIYMVMPQNEPNSDQNFPSCCWTSAGLGRFLTYLCPKMDELGVDVYFGTCERPNPALIDSILTHPQIGSCIKGVGFQWAGKAALPVIREKYDGLTLIQSEQECGDGLNDWAGAIHSWDLFKHYLGNGVSIYDYWNLSLTDKEPSHWDWHQNSLVIVNPTDNSYRYSIEYYLLKHFSHYVLPGAKVIPVPAESDAMAFRNPDGSIAVVAANREATAKSLTIIIDGKAVTIALKPESFSSALLSLSCTPKAGQTATDDTGYKCYSGIYPHLAYYNSYGECGTGAVVPWQGDLWVVTYSPHMPYGSDDKLYQITPGLEEIIRPESIGGTPADRMIHKASNQLFIGPYLIDGEKNVRVIPYEVAPGRPTGVAAHLSDPDNRVLYASMEAGFYDVDIHTLGVKELYKDGNQKQKEGFKGELCSLLPGYHGKGFYSGQGVAIYSNNGEEGELAQKQFDIPSGCLAEWDGKDWKVIRRNQFTEITGPGGIYGNPNPATDPIWSLGWDYKSVILAVREPDKGWSYYRLPKASFAYDGAHGWNTEWPRIRNVGTEESPDYLMTMHGMFWRFPQTFCCSNTAGISPRGAYLKVIADFTEWNGKLVFGCDDSAQSEFLNVREQKGNIGGPGQSNSNLWFGTPDTPDNVGPTTAGGSVWLKEEVEAGVPSDPFLFNGWDNRCAWLANHSSLPATISFQIDKRGNGEWTNFKSVDIEAGGSAFVPFNASDDAVWIRAVSSRTIMADLTFSFAEAETRSTEADPIFAGLASIGGKSDSKALLYGLPDQRRALGVLARTRDGEQYYELDARMNLTPKQDEGMAGYIREKLAVPHNVVTIEGASALIVDSKGRRWRFPLGNELYDPKTDNAELRICREVVTERDLLSLCGTFYELPAENADGYAKVRPVCSHGFAIADYASYRGMLMMTGINHSKGKKNPHIVTSKDGKAAVWAGAIDDLWKMGKPVGHGGPWMNSSVKAGVPSDPFLIGFYDRREMKLSHGCGETVNFTVEVDPTGDGQWFRYDSFSVAPGQTVEHSFPNSFQARWIRITSDKDTDATALFEYR